MKRAVRCAILLAGLSAALAVAPARAADAGNACAAASLSNPEAGGIGGTGAVVNNGSGGIGGTGVVAKEGSGGMGGTGIMAQAGELSPGAGGMGGTGIVGIITGFASICVNGVEVHYDPRTPVSINGQAASTGELAVGQYVVVHAGTVGGQLRAAGIGAIDAVKGVVTGINPGARAIQVLGQTVRLDNAVGQTIAAIKPGASVRISGLRAADGVIVASRVDAVPANAQSSLLGTVSSVAGNVAIVNGTRVALPERPSTAALTAGSEVFVAGNWNGNELRATRVEAQPVHDAIARNDRAIIQGYVTLQQGGQISVGAIAVQLPQDVRVSGGNLQDTGVGRAVQIEVRRAGDRWVADRITLTGTNRSGSGGRPNTTGTAEGSRGSQGANSGNDGGGTAAGKSNSGSSESANSGSSTSGTDSSRSGSSNSGSSGSSSGGSGSSSGSSGTSSSSSGGTGSASGLSGASGASGGSVPSSGSTPGGSGAGATGGRPASGGSASGSTRPSTGGAGGGGRASGSSSGGGRR